MKGKGRRADTHRFAHPPSMLSTAPSSTPRPRIRWLPLPPGNDHRSDGKRSSRVLDVAGRLCTTLARYPTDPAVTGLVDELRDASPDFAR
ncbi:hypothetical protein ACGFY7_26160 [Streptomyces prunicolor]|uniref:MmyB family transcriptional regulator n=1 Tax=Streptomyces prunicolor TaxID=67348 RepID=UPI00371B971C